MSVIKALQRAVRPAVVAVALAVASPAAHAQMHQPTPGGIAVAKQVIAVTGATALFDPLIAGVVEQAKILFLQQNPALAKDLNEISAQMRKDLQPRFSELTEEVAKSYASHLTEQELKAILTFYQSPVGKKFLAQQPLIADNSMKFAQDWANQLSEKVIAQMRVELKKKGHDM